MPDNFSFIDEETGYRAVYVGRHWEIYDGETLRIPHPYLSRYAYREICRRLKCDVGSATFGKVLCESLANSDGHSRIFPAIINGEDIGELLCFE